MHPALYKLMRMQGRAIVRRMLRAGNSPGRLLGLLLGAALCIGWLALVSLPSLSTRADPSRVRAMMPLALLGICILTAITSAGDKAIAFTPGEIDQLFPGPFTRRELIAYKLIKSGLAAILTALILSIVMLKYAEWWPACFTAILMSLLFVQWFSIALLLFGQSLGTSAHTRMRRFVMIGAGALLVLGARPWFDVGAGGAEAAVHDFRASPVGRAVLSPFEPFGQLMTSTSTLDLLKWAFMAALLNAGLVILVVLLDAHYIESAIGASERRYAKIKRLRTGSFLAMGASKTSRWHLPQLPWAGGAGPIAWRQLTNAARSLRGLMLLLLLVAILAAPLLSVAGGISNLAQFLLGVICSLTFLCTNMLSFDFRGDVDHLENLKALPLSASAVAIGQLVAPVLVLTLFHLLLLGISVAVVHTQREILLIGMAICLPFNAILFGTENLIFLLFPSRPVAVSPGDFQVLGQKFVFFLAKLVILIVAGMIAMFAAVLVWHLGGRQLALATAVAGIVLAGEAIGLIPCIAWAYRRFDPSIHTPA